MQYVFPCEYEFDTVTGLYILECFSPSAFAEGETLQEAEEEMHGLLLDILGDCIRFHEKFPEPVEAKGAQVTEVRFTHLQTLKAQLINAMVSSNTRPIDLAELMGITRQEACRILSPRSFTKYETIAQAIDKIGYRLEVKVAPVIPAEKRKSIRRTRSSSFNRPDLKRVPSPAD